MRNCDLEGCHNARDFGGLRIPGGQIASGRLWRGDHLDDLAQGSLGWDKLLAAGCRTVIDLRNADELSRLYQCPPQVERHWIPIDGLEDTEFWDYWGRRWEFGTPRYYPAYLDRIWKPAAQVIRTIIEGPPGGVYFHCVLGRDRTGLIAILLLMLLECPREEIVDDYILGRSAVGPIYEKHGLADERAMVEERLALEGTDLARDTKRILQELDLSRWIERNGISPAEIAALRQRLV